MIAHTTLSTAEIRRKIRRKEIIFGGNAQLRIYGTLACASGKRMKTENRMFFSSESEAIRNGYRPCGHCMRAAYTQWKNGIIQ